MAAVVFPGTGTWPLKAEFYDDYGEGFVAFDSDKTGAEKRRAVTTKAPNKMTFSTILNTAAKADLDEHFKDTCKYGAIRFTWNHPVTGEDIEALYEAPPKVTDRSGVPRYTGTIQLKYWFV